MRGVTRELRGKVAKRVANDRAAGDRRVCDERACASGSRCDDAQCVADTSCPPPQSPKLLFEAPPNSLWAEDENSYVIEIAGREELFGGSIGNDTAAHFHDLATGEDSTLAHAPGVALCSSNPDYCFATEPGAFTLFQSLSSDGHTWSAASQRRYTTDGWPIFTGADLAAHRVATYDTAANTMSVLDTDSGSVLFTFGYPNSLAGFSFDARGRTAFVDVAQNDDSGEVTSRASIDFGATFDVVYRGETIKTTYPLLLIEDTHYAVRDNGLADYTTTRIERLDGAVPTTLGTFTDPPLSSFDSDYRDQLLEPGPAVYTLDCWTAGRCRSFLVHLDPVSVEAIAQSPLPAGQLLRVTNVRRLACGARDLVLHLQQNAGGSHQFWSLRVLGREGLP